LPLPAPNDRTTAPLDKSLKNVQSAPYPPGTGFNHVAHITPQRFLLPNSQDHNTPEGVDHDTTPPANRSLLTVAGVLLLLPIIALMWVSSYARVEPKLGAFPFFIWYQFLWVFLCSACTYTAYRLVLKARPHRRMTSDAPKNQEPGR
jgi:hypothetical protein